MADMKNKIIFTMLGIIATTFSFCAFAKASGENESLGNKIQFHAVNAGYKDDNSSQNYDFIELAKTDASDIDITPYKIEYYNSSDKLSGTISFPELSLFQGERLILGFAISPQYAESPSPFLYDFGSSGLASTAGRLRLILNDELIDEICWGKISCDNSYSRFATSAEGNLTAIRCLTDECQNDERYQKYYPEISEESLEIIEAVAEPGLEEDELVDIGKPSCRGIVFNELFSYYIDGSSEQYIELYNAANSELSLDYCTLRYKNKNYPLHGVVAPNDFVLIQDIVLTKNPSSSLTLELLDGDNVADAMNYSRGQKKGVALARFGEK